MAELERLQLDLRLKGQVAALEAAPFTPRKTAGTTQLAAGYLPELSSVWAAAAAMPPPPPLPGVPQPEGFDLLAAASGGVSGVSGSAAPSAPSLVSLLPELAASFRLPAASTATLSKHAVLPAGLEASRFGGSSSGSNVRAAALPSQQPDQAAPSQQRRPAYPQLEPPPAGSVEAALAELDISSSQQLASYPLPSPYDGGLALGPQEVEVVTAPAPTQPLAPGETCCALPVQQQQQQHAPALPSSASSSGLQEVRKRQSLRDVHISVAMMDEFMRWARGLSLLLLFMLPLLLLSLPSPPVWGPAALTLRSTLRRSPPRARAPRYAMSNTRRGIETCGILAGKLSPDDALFTITTLIVPKQTGTTDTGAWAR